MSISSRLLGTILKLPPAETRQILLEKELEVPMPDGVVLLADHYAPEGLGERPTVLVRSPYGRSGFFGLLFGRFIAERGFHVLVQSCRGTFGSGGTLDPFRNERADGLATVAWLRTQPWFNGVLATAGPSYLGFVQWAIASEVPELQAMSTWISSAEFRSPIYPGDAIYLEAMLTWTELVNIQETFRLGLFGQAMHSSKKREAAFWHLPLDQADRAVLGKNIPFWQDWMIHDQPGDEWWAEIDYSFDVPKATAPNLMIGGWYDLFLPQTIRDYHALQQAGRQPYLTIGPWAHTDTQLFPVALNETITWLRTRLLPEQDGLRRAPVRIYVMGADEWRDLPAWPPAYNAQPWYLQPDGRLAPTLPPESAPDRYQYDPAKPTPHVGGAGMGKVTGPKDNRAVETRPDVLVYTSDVLEQDLEVIGPVTAVLYLQSSLPHTDFFARLCDVDPSGKSTNLCDGLIRLFPGKVVPDAEGCLKVTLELWPTANRFKRGHRLRLQVSSGAFPRWARNTGSGEPSGTAVTLKVAEQTVYHDPGRPSAIYLPITPDPR
jgi:hypothetical protein